MDKGDLRQHLVACSSELRHRGPDWSGYLTFENEEGLNHGIAHERLAIMDPESGEQPLVSEDGNIIVAANGEIYNYKDLYSALEADGEVDYKPKTGSDCEVRFVKEIHVLTFIQHCLSKIFYHLIYASRFYFLCT